MVKENVLKIIFNNLNIDIISNINLTSNNICLIFCCNLWWWSLSIGIIVSCSASQKTLQSVGGLKSNYITIYLTIFFFLSPTAIQVTDLGWFNNCKHKNVLYFKKKLKEKNKPEMIKSNAKR